MAAEVAPLPRLKQAPGPSLFSPEQRYWNSFSSQLLVPSPHSSPITHISAPQTSSSSLAGSGLENFAVTSGNRVQVFSSRTRKLLKTITRFGADDNAHSGTIRRDGRVLVAGGDSGAIQVFDINSRAILKSWREHKQPVWVTKWHPREPTSLMSACDDTTVRLWDLPAESSIQTFVGHTDYARSGGFLPGQAQRLLVSGSYDTTVRLWDSRAGSNRAVITFKHADPVEAVLPMPSGTTLLAAAGNAISVLDLVAARPAHMIRNHQKTVTALALASGGTRVVAGALDGHVKVFEASGWNVVAGMKYPSPILALDIVHTPAASSSSSETEREDKHLAVGLQSGLLSLKTRISGQQKAVAREREKEMQALAEGRIEEYDRRRERKTGKKRGRGWERATRGRDFTGEGADIAIRGDDRGRLKPGSPWEVALRKGQYSRALEIVLDKKKYPPADVLTLLTALRHRSALRAALSPPHPNDAAVAPAALPPLLRFLTRRLADPRSVRLAADVAAHALDLHAHLAGGADPEVGALVARMAAGVRKGVEASQAAWAAGGMVGLLVGDEGG